MEIGPETSRTPLQATLCYSSTIYPTEDLEGGAILDCRLLNLSVAGCSITSTPVQVLKPANKALPINVAAAEISQIWAL